MAHPLDRPVWNALTGRWSAFARGDARALALETDYGPFAAAADDSAESQAALAALVPAGGVLWIVETEPQQPPPGSVAARTALLYQMAAPTISPGRTDFPIEQLGDDDADEMRALATLTEPGPFLARTHKFGGFIGIRDNGRLVAMAGRRMRPPGFTEVSGVCTHPDFRGRGYAGALMRIVARRILDEDETPFLHVYAANKGAIALYETLGFRLRAEMQMLVLARA